MEEASTSTGVSRPTSLLKTSSTCSLEAASPPVSVFQSADSLQAAIDVESLQKVISVPCFVLFWFFWQQVHTPSATTGGGTAIRQTISRRGQKSGETYENGVYFDKCWR